MKDLTLLLLFISSQFAFSQTGEDVNAIYIECEGDSIAVDVSEFPNLPPEMLFEMFDCSDVDDWSWGDDSLDEDWNGPDWDDDFWDFDSTDVNNPWDEEDDDFWDFDSTDVNNPWGDENLVFEMVCSNGDVFEVSLSDMIDSSEDLIASLCGENGVDEDWNGPGWDDDFWDFDSTDVNNPWDEEDDDFWDFDSTDVNNPWGDENLVFEMVCSNGDVFEVSLSDMIDSSEDLIASLCGENGVDEDWNGPDWDDDFWDFDSTDVSNPWDEEELAFDCINSSPEAFELYLSCMNGDEGACEALEILCGEEEEEEEEEEEWGDDIDALIEQLENDCASQVDLGWSCGMLEMIYSCMNGSEDTCQYLEEIYEDFDFEEGEEEEEEEWSWGEGENMGALFDAISSFTVTENELVLVLEANDLIVSVFDESGFDFSPSVVDGYLVFGPFDINELYNIIIENMDGLEVLWGLFKPMASDVELFEEGIVSAIDNNFGDIFNLNQMVSIDEVHQDLKVYNTQYYDVMGRKVSNPSKGLYIEVQTTNLGEISTKKFIQK